MEKGRSSNEISGACADNGLIPGRSLLAIAQMLLALIIFWMASSQVHAGNLSLLVNGKAIHLDPPADKHFNERNWGAGLQYDFDAIGYDKNWIPFVAVSGFKDSLENNSYYVGGGLMHRFIPFDSFNAWHIDAGLIAFFMTRKDYKDNSPFFGALPAFSFGTSRVSMNMTYVPKVHPKAVKLLYFQLKVTFGDVK
jgi:hypothetical protein